MPATRRISAQSFKFLGDLADNNDRDWFQANKQRYEDELREPALRLVRDFAPCLADISPYFRADDRKSGGSMFRIYRDIRFSKDKSPYKTHTGLQFRHEQGKDAHCPGYYLHLEPRRCFAAVGIWHPHGETLKLIRAAISANPDAWEKAGRGRAFLRAFELSGDSLKRAPKGYAVDHPAIDDLKRKDFIGVAELTQKQVTGAGFVEDFAALCKTGSPLVEFLCKAIGVPF